MVLKVRFLIPFKIISATTSIKGKMVATSKPSLRLPPAISETLPTIAGLAIPPKSPASAKSANIAVPPLGQFCDEILMDPGHIMPTVKPHTAQPKSPKIEILDKEANK